jgi:hypothetical protein
MVGAAAGCATTKSTAPQPAATAAAPAHEQGMGMGMMAGMCPMQVPGTTVAATDVEGGVALSFTTSTGDVNDLRQRVHHMADMHDQMHGQGGMMGGMGGSPTEGAAPAEHPHDAGAGQGACPQGMMKSGGMMMPPATASAEDIPGGARLILQPKDPAQLGALREHTHMHAERMAKGECPMMAPQPRPGAGDAEHEAHHPPK